MKITSLLLAGILVSSAPLGGWAEDQAGNRSAVCRIEWQKLSGRVEKADLEKGQLQLRDKNGNLAHVHVDPDVEIFRDWRMVAINDVKVNDRITLRRGASRL